MLKKIVIASVMATNAVASVAFADFYMGPTLLYSSASVGNSHYQTIVPMLSLGYGGMVRECTYLAGELFGTQVSFPFRNGSGPSLKTTSLYGFSVLPGFYYEDVMIYGRLGVASANFTNLSATRTGYQLGAGLQAALSETWSIRGEYIYSHYKTIHPYGSPTANAAGIGFMYEFA